MAKPEGVKNLAIVPVDFGEAQQYVETYHRHLGKVVNCKFVVGCADMDKGVIIGVAIVGRPVARLINDGWTLEVNRCCTDGSVNACSMLYAACWRIAKAMGYKRLVTYTHKDTESGASLRGAGWKVVGETKWASWNNKNRPRVDKGPQADKYKWEIKSVDELGNPRSMIKVVDDDLETSEDVQVDFLDEQLTEVVSLEVSV